MTKTSPLPVRFILCLVLGMLLPLLTLSGCATLPPAMPPAKLADHDVGRALIDHWMLQSAANRSLQGVAKVRVQTTERTLNGTQVVLVEAPDRLRAETLSPFGNPLLVLAVDGSELGVLLPGDNTFYRGRPTPENLGRFTRLPLRLVDLVGILLFRPPLVDYRGLEAFVLPEGGWRVELEAGLRRQFLVFDDARRLKEVRYLYAGELQLALVYSDFDGLLKDVPRRTELDLPMQKTRASLTFSELAMGREFLPGIFRLEIPENATVIPLDEELFPGPAADRLPVQKETPREGNN